MDLLDAADCRLLFDAVPSACLVLKPDRNFTVVAASQRYLSLSGTERESLIGRGLFELFPDNLDASAASGVGELRQSLLRVVKEVAEDVMAIYEYSVDRHRDSASASISEHRYWRLTNAPVLDGHGELRFIIHHVEDVTETIRNEEQVQRRQQDELRSINAHGKRLRAEIEQHRETARRANLQLQTAIETLDHREIEIAGLRTRLETLSCTHRAQDHLAQSVFDSMYEGAFVLDHKLRVSAVNRAFTEVTGYSSPEMLGQMPLFLRASRTPPGTYAAIWDALNAHARWEGELWNRRKSGELFLQRLIITAITGAGSQPARYVGVFTDITELRRKDEHLQHLAFYDALTDLPNRLLLQDRLQHALERAGREHRHLAVLFIDLDRFKPVNDGFGHDIGDLVLQNVARRLLSSIRSMDTVARLGGDEFIVVLEEVDGRGDGLRIANNIIAMMDVPVELDERTFKVGASIGIALFPEDGHSAAELIRKADAAMYTAKALGGNRAQLISDIAVADACEDSETPASRPAVDAGQPAAERDCPEDTLG